MFQNLLSIFKSKKDVASREDIEGIPSLVTLQSLLNDNVDLVSEKELLDNADDNEVLNYLSEIFDDVITKLESNTRDIELANKWPIVLREILVGVQYRGKYLEDANKIKEKLDKNQNIQNCTV